MISIRSQPKAWLRLCKRAAGGAWSGLSSSGVVDTEIDEHLGFDVDSSGKIDVVHVQAIGDRWQYQHMVWPSLTPILS